MTKSSLFIILIFTLFSAHSVARSPAVEPVMGISIEEYEHVDPSQAVPFDFSNEQEASRSPAIEVPETFEFVTPARTADFAQETAETKISPYIVALALLLPIVIWFGLLKNMDKELEQNAAQAANNTIDLQRERQKRMANENGTEKDDISKAS